MTNEIAERYGQGLLELAKENNTVREKKEQAEILVQAMDENPDIALLFNAVKITKEEKKDFIDKAFEKAADQDMIHLLKLTIDKGRSFYIRDILKAYISLAEEELGIVKATVTSANPLCEEDLQKIRYSLTKKYRKEIILTNKIDPSLIAGIKVTVGNNVTDISMKSKIEDMRNLLLKGGQA